jgi:hypothetical protein
VNTVIYKFKKKKKKKKKNYGSIKREELLDKLTSY